MKNKIIKLIILFQLCIPAFNFQNVEASDDIEPKRIEYRENSDAVLKYQKSEYKKFTKSFIKISPKRIGTLIGKKTIYVFWGRASCPFCRAFVPSLAQLSKKRKINIYYIDTENTDSNKILRSERKRYKVKTVPTLIKIKDKKSFKTFNHMKETLEHFLKKKY